MPARPPLSADTRTLLLALAVAAGTLLCGFCIHRHIPLQGLLLSLPLCAAHRYRDLRDLPPGSPLLDGTHLPGLLAVLAHVLLLPAFPLTASACVLYPLVMLLRAPHPWHSRPAVMLLPAALIPAGAGALLLRCRNGNFSATALLVPQTLSWVHAFCAGAAGLVALLLLFFFRDFYIRGAQPAILLAGLSPLRRRLYGLLLDLPGMAAALGVFAQAGLLLPGAFVPCARNRIEAYLLLYTGAAAFVAAMHFGPAPALMLGGLFLAISTIPHFRGAGHAAAERRLIFVRNNNTAPRHQSDH